MIPEVMMKKLLLFASAAMTAAALAVSAFAVDHRVVRGDTMWKLSRAYGVTLESVINANPQVKDPDLIYPDDILHIPTDDDDAASYEYEVFTIVNTERRSRGLKELEYDVGLSRIARLKSQDMKDKRYFSHQSPTYGSPFQMMKDNGIKYRSAGENIAMGQRTPSEVVQTWMNSPGHRANILDPSFTRVGVGYVREGNYWTQMFAG